MYRLWEDYTQGYPSCGVGLRELVLKQFLEQLFLLKIENTIACEGNTSYSIK